MSIGLCANAADALPRLLRRGFAADIVTDQTSAHDPLVGYVPDRMTLAEADALRAADPDEYVRRSRASIAAHCAAMVGFLDAGAEVFDYGNSLRAEARLGGFERAFAYPGFVPAYVRPLFCEGKGPFRWVALSGDPGRHRRDRSRGARRVPRRRGARALDRACARADRLPGPAGAASAGWATASARGSALRFNAMVASGELRAPVVIGRDHLDAGSVASPYRETEGMADESDAIADWPLLNALVNTASGATWVSIHHGGGVGIGRSIHAGMVCVADGTPLAAQKLERVLTADPGTGVMRHADAGYERAIEVAERARRADPDGGGACCDGAVVRARLARRRGARGGRARRARRRRPDRLRDGRARRRATPSGSPA